jgi:hypothetical protein
MNHLSEDLLNEYLDGALAPSALAEVAEHLAVCGQCAGLAAELTGLFTDLASLPEIALEHDLAPNVLQRLELSQPLPNNVNWILAIQVILAGLVIGLAAPLLDVSVYIPANAFTFPSLPDLPTLLTTEGALLMRSFQHFNLPTLSAWNFLPSPNLSNLALGFSLLSVSLLWLAANGFLLRPRGRWLSRR